MITLNILNKRKDGYHNLKSVFDFVDLYDEITTYKNQLLSQCTGFDKDGN